MAGATGLELATFCVTGRRSNQLNYAPAMRIDSSSRKMCVKFFEIHVNFLNFTSKNDAFLGIMNVKFDSSRMMCLDSFIDSQRSKFMKKYLIILGHWCRVKVSLKSCNFCCIMKLSAMKELIDFDFKFSFALMCYPNIKQRISHEQNNFFSNYELFSKV